MGHLAIIWDCLVLSLFSVYKQILFFIYPDERTKDLEKATNFYKFLDEGKNPIVFKQKKYKKSVIFCYYRRKEIPFLEESRLDEQFPIYLEHDQNSLLYVSKILIKIIVIFNQSKASLCLNYYDIFQRLTRDHNKTARLGEPSPNPVLYDVRTKGRVQLLDNNYFDQSIPMVLNFGSCT